MKILALIPARYASTRFPAKPLALLANKPIVQHVYERVASVVTNTYVATDDERIATAVRQFGGRVLMTASTHPSGTDRCREALEQLNEHYDVVINIQGDEPFVEASQIKALANCFEQTDTDIATLVKPFTPDMGIEALRNPNSPKVVVDSNNCALLFSRSVIPHLRGIAEDQWLNHHLFLKHIGLYAYRADVLRAISQLPCSPLERAESLEQLRWLEAGYKIRVAHSNIETIGIDTPEDLRRAEEFLQQQN